MSIICPVVSTTITGVDTSTDGLLDTECTICNTDYRTDDILGTNSPPVEVSTPVIVILTTGQMILLGTNSLPVEVSTPVIVIQTTGQMILSGTNSPPVEVSTPVIVILTTGQMILSGTNREVLIVHQ